LGNRRKAREFALQVLYEIDVAGEDPGEAFGLFWDNFDTIKEARDFSELLVGGVVAHKAEIDGLIEKFSENWSLGRMATVDRNILRAAVYELLYLDDIPPNVTINEAIDIGKKFSSENSGAFINGILDRISVYIREKSRH
jgi:N utilization substance protein B